MLNQRKHLRALRRNLSKTSQISASRKIVLRLIRSKELAKTKNLALYFACDGEVDLTALLTNSFFNRYALYLPQIESNGSLTFRQFRGKKHLRFNRFGILEPNKKCPHIPVTQLDTILLPLVGFDREGNRLGMGGGFYDKTLAFTHNSYSKLPAKVGVAYAIQELPHMEANPWDVPLDAIVTEQGWIKPSRKPKTEFIEQEKQKK